MTCTIQHGGEPRAQFEWPDGGGDASAWFADDDLGASLDLWAHMPERQWIDGHGYKIGTGIDDPELFSLRAACLTRAGYEVNWH